MEAVTLKYNTILRNMDILYSLMLRTKLNKDNQMTLMQGIKGFI